MFRCSNPARPPLPMFISWLFLMLVSTVVSSPGAGHTLRSNQHRGSPEKSGWWPTKAGAPRNEYGGPQVCAECHSTLAKGQNEHAMAHTSMAAAGSALLAHGDARYKEGPFSYRIHLEDRHAYHSVSGPTDTLSSLLLWAFGSGSVGQSYLFEYDGALYEARISFLDGRGFELTPGYPPDIPESVKFAVGRPIPSDEQVKCFGCHTVASRAGDRFDPAQAMLGISCEGCHGPGLLMLRWQNPA
jgi:Cytochrome c554 and c-prime